MFKIIKYITDNEINHPYAYELRATYKHWDSPPAFIKDENIVTDSFQKINDFIDLDNLYFILDVLNYRLYEHELTDWHYETNLCGPDILVKLCEYTNLLYALPKIRAHSNKEKHIKGYDNYFKYLIITDKMKEQLKDDRAVKQIIKFTLNEFEFTVDDKRKKEKLEKFLYYLLTNSI